MQSELAGALEVSVTPVREALRELESQGLVDSGPFRGSAVHQVSLEELQEIHELRRLLIPTAARERVGTVTDAEIDQARALLGQLATDLPNRVWVETARTLRRVLEGTSERRNLRAILARLSDISELYAGLAVHTENDRRSVLGDHEALVQAYSERDAERVAEVELRRLDQATRRTAAALRHSSRTR
ncbi:GntR family transcriptional regulator [Kineosporia sp. NBRC 101677]|nr:GntR family transcriptional regulator [Kineosporia sp. NBRC 101677]